ncbi:aromatic ring-hydroxylating oxygenase subunit alpha [Sporolactobacillus putidus]|uniref:Vanillate O-demethylase oxygenase subunit (4-hydroxy-3-methoxybenzoate demethylase) n=1 Tax=Sporolactobacillus putidus TaxID=492735 RepID=A0A917S5Y9_9BACL|nr:aromatic ring-hydroxylating dioxygenase subunit alpha [Sporolactobacillus putidus]GGL59428.1 vanillate O-demethylase oxygenase subunit (4-hydroxy-3-methoxybenzoate demethylase) [Sporolactobacillus putidus]
MALTHTRRNTPYPTDCTFTKNDWPILAQHWYPVARSEEVADKPLAVKLLDVELVVYRAGGKAVVARDLCIHRGTPLSMGWVEDDKIVCPYHGFSYAADGQCVSIPAHPEAKISPRLCLTVYPSVERYGLVWTTLAGEEEKIPPLDVWGNDDYISFLAPTIDINGSAGRQVEGFLDVAHFAWVHTETFADRNNAFVPSYKVSRTDDGIHTDYLSTVSNYPKGMHDPSPADFKWLREYDVYPPLSARLIVHFPEGKLLWILNAASPISARKTRLFCPIAQNFDKNLSIEGACAFNLRIFNEDREMVENQKPEELPLDLQAEAHIMADKTSIAYRKLLKEMGLGRQYTA